MYGSSLEEKTYFFDGKGNVYIDPVSSQDSDLSKAYQKGTYSLSGKVLQITLGASSPISSEYKSDNANLFTWNAGTFRTAQPVEWSKFAGKFEGGFSSLGGGSFAANSRSYEFYNNGQLQGQSTGSISTDSANASSASSQSGKWSADGYELTLEAGGKTTKGLAYLANALPEYLMIQGMRFTFQPTSLASSPPSVAANFSVAKSNPWPLSGGDAGSTPASLGGIEVIKDLAYKPTSDLQTLISSWLGSTAKSLDLQNAQTLSITAKSWQASIKLVSVGKAPVAGGRIDATQIVTGQGPQGSILVGGDGKDTLWGRAGWDLIDGRGGADLIRAGNGRDIITGGSGSDEMHGDFGWNTYTSSDDNYSDLIVVKSDQYLLNPLFGASGNNSDSSKCDIIEELDEAGKIKILGVSTEDLCFAEGVIAHDILGIGIYAKESLEALYTGNNLTIDQIMEMTTGDLNAPVGGAYVTW
mgnify:CR=1 FL=1